MTALERFWKFGEIVDGSGDVVLRPVEENDREVFLEIQKENSMMKSMLGKEKYCDLLWEEHLEEKALMCTIEVDGEYAGYCGIKNTEKERWEIAIELLKAWTHRGIGYTALYMLLKEIKARIGVCEFRIRIDPENYASQSLFEKIGAVPNGISEFLIHGEEELIQIEEENLHLLDDKLIEVAKKFKVEPRKLLSHVLEYKLVWEEKFSCYLKIEGV